MTKSLTISKKLPESKSMQYDPLRKLGIAKSQELAGKIWTDYNIHDPGVTILEALSYLLTDLGHRVNYDIRDILTDSPASDIDLKNFYTACQILPNCPVTFNDFRKLLMDVEVVEDDPDCQYAGVRNAWISKAADPPAEWPIYVDRKNSLLSLDPIEGVTAQESFYVKFLYDVLLEFDKCERFGDLNSNVIEGTLIVDSLPANPALEGIEIEIQASFPLWDDEDVDWDNPVSVQLQMHRIDLEIDEEPDLHEITFAVTNSNEVILSGIINDPGNPQPIVGLVELSDLINDYIYQNPDGLLQAYLEKIEKVHEIIEEVKKRLCANRNLCDDWFRLKAVRVEDVLICADVELTPEADVDEVEAEIFFRIGNFLSPEAPFRTLDEMLNLCMDIPRTSIIEIDHARKIFTLQKTEDELIVGALITVLKNEKALSEYTITCVDSHADELNWICVTVEEEIEFSLPDDDVVELESVINGTQDVVAAYEMMLGTIDEELCLTVDQVFEGPKLKHGFISDHELAETALKKFVHVSDLIQIIMDIPGVRVVKSIQIANKPQDENPDVPSQSVKWCLELAVDKCYVPRIDIENSRMTYYKDQLPFFAKEEEVEHFLDKLESSKRPQKIRYPHMDIPIPKGVDRNLSDYRSVQEEFPEAYGIGSNGIPGLAGLDLQGQILRKSQVKQLKGFLMFYDQLAANYLSQLDHVKHLFSMNSEQNEFGEYLIDRTYFTQPLYDLVPDADPLYVDKNGHLVQLRAITEDKALYEERRNRFLDHMLARFAESFSEYALLAYKVSGPKAKSELIQDKLQFLNRYPKLSSERGKGMDICDPCQTWHIDNVSGVEQRSHFLLGMPPRKCEALHFDANFIIEAAGDQFTYRVETDANVDLLHSSALFDSKDDAKCAIESLIVMAINDGNYQVIIGDNPAEFAFQIVCNDEIIAVSARRNYTSDADGGDTSIDIQLLQDIALRELLDNPLANRKNLECPLSQYFETIITPQFEADPDVDSSYTVDYTLFSQPGNNDPANAILSGNITRFVKDVADNAEVLALAEEQLSDVLFYLLNLASDPENYLFDPESPGIGDDYFFILLDGFGDEIGRSIEKNFNEQTVELLSLVTPKELQIKDSTGNDGPNDFTIIESIGPDVRLLITGGLIDPTADGKTIFSFSPDVVSIDAEVREITIDGLWKAHLSSGDHVLLTRESIHTDMLVISQVSESAGKSTLRINHEIPTGDTISSTISFERTYNVTDIQGDFLFIDGMAHTEAVSNMAEFIKATFFRKEGMHLIEHTLLRPLINEEVMQPVAVDSLQEGLANPGVLYFPVTVAIDSVLALGNVISILGDLSTELNSGDTISVLDGSLNDGSYQIDIISFDGTHTNIEVIEDILFSAPDPDYPTGNMQFEKVANITSIQANISTIEVSEADALNLVPGEEVSISGSTDQINDHQFLVGSTTDLGGSVGVTLSDIAVLLQDKLLPIHLNEAECESCKITDPYSCIATVVLPYWAERFTNIDVRKFIEKTIRTEAPAHVLLNICWIDCDQMSKFERAYKLWLIEPQREPQDLIALAEALAAFITVISELSNVYPTGTLHSCDEDDSFEKSIILNRSTLGTF